MPFATQASVKRIQVDDVRQSMIAGAATPGIIDGGGAVLEIIPRPEARDLARPHQTGS